jgi:hypothetical protein
MCLSGYWEKKKLRNLVHILFLAIQYVFFIMPSKYVGGEIVVYLDHYAAGHRKSVPLYVPFFFGASVALPFI